MTSEGGTNQPQRAPSAPASNSAFAIQVPPLAPDSIPTSAAAVETASREAQALANDNLEREAKKNSHSRREAIRNIIHWIKVAFLIVTFVLIIAAILIVAFHAMTPWSFLTAAQLSALHTMLTSSLVTGVAATMGKNILKDISGP